MQNKKKDSLTPLDDKRNRQLIKEAKTSGYTSDDDITRFLLLDIRDKLSQVIDSQKQSNAGSICKKAPSDMTPDELTKLNRQPVYLPNWIIRDSEKLLQVFNVKSSQDVIIHILTIVLNNIK